jgi:hypothetical protein
VAVPAAERLFQIVIRADGVRRQRLGIPAANESNSKRLWVEPFFNFLGLLLAQMILWIPWPKRGQAHVWVCEKMALHPPEANPALGERQNEAVRLAHELFAQYRKWPAALVVTTHPDTVGPLAWLRFELLRQGLVIANALINAAPATRERRHAQCFLAIDPFALDSVPTPIAALYSGFIHRQYLAWDRQASTESWIQKRCLLRGAGVDRTGWRVIQALHRNPVLLAFGGGLPHNARLWYGVREWSRLLPAAARRAVLADLMTIISTPQNNAVAAESGRVPADLRKRLAERLREAGLPLEKAESALAALEIAFAPEVPSRERLIQILYRRLVQRGTPVLFLPIKHAATAPHVQIGPPIAMTRDHPAAPTSEAIASILRG